MKNITQKANITGGKEWDAHTNTQLDARQVTTSSCTVIAQQRLLVHLCTKRVINTKTHRINCSLWLYCGSYLSLMQSILIRDVNYPCDSRQLICFVFFPLHSPATPAYQFPRRSILSLFLPKGLINCRQWVYRAGIFLFPVDFPLALASANPRHAFRAPQSKMALPANIDTVSRAQPNECRPSNGRHLWLQMEHGGAYEVEGYDAEKGNFSGLVYSVFWPKLKPKHANNLWLF